MTLLGLLGTDHDSAKFLVHFAKMLSTHVANDTEQSECSWRVSALAFPCCCLGKHLHKSTRTRDGRLSRSCSWHTIRMLWEGILVQVPAEVHLPQGQRTLAPPTSSHTSPLPSAITFNSNSNKTAASHFYLSIRTSAEGEHLSLMTSCSCFGNQITANGKNIPSQTFPFLGC